MDEKKATPRQMLFIENLGLLSGDDLNKLTFDQASKLLNEHVPKFHARKLVEWGIYNQAEVDAMMPQELKDEYRRYSSIQGVRQANEYIKNFSVGEVVWNRTRNTKCTIVTIRKSTKGRRNNFTVEYEGGKKQAVNCWAIEKLEPEKEG